MSQSTTYITYNEGVEAKHLHLGNLAHNWAHPNDLEPYVDKTYVDLSDTPPASIQLASIENFALTLGKASDDDDDDNDSENETPSEQAYLVAAAPKATRLELKDPDEFFEQVTLKSEAAKKWLSSHLAAAQSLSSNQHPLPKVWMLTGLILMSHATWTRLSSKEHTFVPGQKAPFDPTGVSAIRKLSVSEGVRPAMGFKNDDGDDKNVSGSIIHETGKYPGMRAWAAQWQEVEVKLVELDKVKKGVPNLIPLQPVTASKVAVVELKDEVYAKKGSEEDFDENYWDELLDTAEKYE